MPRKPEKNQNRIVPRPITLILVFLIVLFPASALAKKNIVLSSINWEPYTGENLPDHGFFSELVSRAFSKAGYRVKYKYFSWARALREAKLGNVHGVMVAYWKKERTGFLVYPEVVWRVKEEFITLRDNSITYTGRLSDLKGSTIGVLEGSAQAEELQSAGLQTQSINEQIQNVRMLLAGRIDAMLIPRNIFFFHLDRMAPQFQRRRVKILHPPYKIYDMYVAFSKQKPNHFRLTKDFNRGLGSIKADGTFLKILNKHNVKLEDTE